jgi:hypothetical protein
MLIFLLNLRPILSPELVGTSLSHGRANVKITPNRRTDVGLLNSEAVCLIFINVLHRGGIACNESRHYLLF